MRLQQRERQPLEERRQHIDIARGEQVGNIVPMAEQPDMPIEPFRCDPRAQFALQRPHPYP